MSVAWSQACADFQCKDRLFDSIISNSKAAEEREQKRLIDVSALQNQRKRGTRDITSTEHSEIKPSPVVVAVRQQNNSVQPSAKPKSSSHNVSKVNDIVSRID